MPRGYIHTSETLFKKVKKSKSGCWNFTGPICKKLGYGKIGYKGKVTNAHRLAWILSNGPIDSVRIFVCHKCDNRKCINPDHLFLGTAKDNTSDMIKKGRRKARSRVIIAGKYCNNGHLLTNKNIYEHTPSGNRRCMICSSEKRKMKYQQLKQDRLK